MRFQFYRVWGLGFRLGLPSRVQVCKACMGLRQLFESLLVFLGALRGFGFGVIGCARFGV